VFNGILQRFFESAEITIHDNGGQVYMDGAMNAQVGLTNPNLALTFVTELHKTLQFLMVVAVQELVQFALLHNWFRFYQQIQ
jgi:hypothetical protein